MGIWTSKPKFIGLFMGKGWKAKLPFYSWFCEECKQWVINYPSGHYNDLKCPSCLQLEGIEIKYEVRKVKPL